IRFSKELDYEDWKDRLLICRLDLKRLDLLEKFIDYLNKNISHIDIIINNAAQTVRRPNDYYSNLIDNNLKEMQLLSNKFKVLISEFNRNNIENSYENTDILQLVKSDTSVSKGANDYNSWVLRMDEISPLELLEVQIINVTSPFLLNSKLKKLMINSPNMNRFIINVSSVEGLFSQKKKSRYHVHTNMAKAAVNMMTKTASRDFAADRIYIYSVDPGWVSNQFPESWEGFKETDFEAPLDYLDAASRLCDPVYSYLRLDKPPYGEFYKDYNTVDW
ncbi:MAG TPA: SDR family oxidoreductase, partial [Clostridia bacterium]